MPQHREQLLPSWAVGPPGNFRRVYLPTLAACTAALVIAFLATPLIDDDSIAALTFVAAVGLAGWYGGLMPALVASALGGLAIDYFFESPAGTLEVTSSATVLDLLSFLVVALLVGKLKARLRASDSRLRAAKDSRDELVDTVSHELRTPLTSIRTSVYSLRDRAEFLPTESRDSLLSTIEVQTERLTRFIDSAIALRRLENGVELHLELVDPAEVASAVLDRYAQRLDDRSTSLVVEEGLPLVRIDPALIDQALSALVDNVTVHTPRSTPLRVEVAIVDRDLRMSVSDGGPGLPAGAQEWVFEKYHKVSEHTPGLGLGLAVARAAVHAHGGRLWVAESRLGGAQFVIDLPDVVATPIAA